MKKLSRRSLRNLILQEIKSMEEDYIVKPGAGKDSYYDHENTCEQCGSGSMYEGECSECGYSMYEKETKEEYGSLNEGDCGCGSMDYDYDKDDDFIPDHMEDLNYMHPTHGKRTVADITMLDPDSAFGVGFEAGLSGVFDEDGDVKVGNHKHYKGSYMAKNHMYKTAKYAQKLYHMIPDSHNLEDWMRSKLAQIADDISEVYHALDHDIFEGDV